MDWSDVIPHLTGYAHLATADATGVPHVSRVATVERDGDLVFFSNWSSKKVRNIAANPRVSIMFAPMAEAYLQGPVDLVDDHDAKSELWNSGLLSYDPAAFFQTAENPDLVLVVVHPASASVMTMDAQGPHVTRWAR